MFTTFAYLVLMKFAAAATTPRSPHVLAYCAALLSDHGRAEETPLEDAREFILSVRRDVEGTLRAAGSDRRLLTRAWRAFDKPDEVYENFDLRVPHLLPTPILVLKPGGSIFVRRLDHLELVIGRLKNLSLNLEGGDHRLLGAWTIRGRENIREHFERTRLNARSLDDLSRAPAEEEGLNRLERNVGLFYPARMLRRLRTTVALAGGAWGASYVGQEALEFALRLSSALSAFWIVGPLSDYINEAITPDLRHQRVIQAWHRGGYGPFSYTPEQFHHEVTRALDSDDIRGLHFTHGWNILLTEAGLRLLTTDLERGGASPELMSQARREAFELQTQIIERQPIRQPFVLLSVDRILSQSLRDGEPTLLTTVRLHLGMPTLPKPRRRGGNARPKATEAPAWLPEGALGAR